jgi:hypothetical protein
MFLETSGTSLGHGPLPHVPRNLWHLPRAVERAIGGPSPDVGEHEMSQGDDW